MKILLGMVALALYILGVICITLMVRAMFLSPMYDLRIISMGIASIACFVGVRMIDYLLE